MEQPQNEQKQQKNMGYGMIIAMWALIFGLLAFLFQDVLETQHNPNQQINAYITENNTRELTLERNHYGHYVANGLINDQDVTFMLDTGATDVSIPAKVADRIGLKRGVKMFYQTANGRAAVFATKINNISIGNIELTNVRATINPNVDDMEVLLGMSFLKELEFTQRGNTLTIRQHTQ
jgi:aspartyl protease family protein